VTFQFVFKLSAILLLVNFHQSGSQRGSRAALFAAFFFFGLAMWDKANFAWVLLGLFAAAVTVFPGEIRRHLTGANAGIAAGGALLGALPLVIYNFARSLETFRSTAHLEPAAIWGKYIILTRSMDGSVFFGFLTAVDPGPNPGVPNHFYQTLAIAISKALGYPSQNLTLWATGIAVLSLALLWRTPARRPILFALVAGLFTWLPMVLTAGAGAAAQHVLLIWPLHLFAIAVAIDRIPWRAAIVGVTLLLCASSIAVTTRYYADLVVNGPTLRWTDAMDPLQRALEDLHAKRIYVADWGLIETMNLVSEGSLPMRTGSADPVAMRSMLDDKDGIFVAHPPEIAFHPEERATLEEFAQREHYTKEPVATIRDRNGRPAFDVFRFRKLPL
jgi:hypothetical protein